MEKNPKTTKTSWGKVAPWYNELLESKRTYQKDVILPKLVRMMEIKKGEKILDVACGQGFFTSEFAKLGAHVVGADISPELIDLARTNFPKISFEVVPADKQSIFPNQTFDTVTIILALQNISDLQGTLKECGRILKNGGKLFIVLNHPAFRIPKKSSWEFDEKNKIQYRRIEKYLSEIMTKIEMNPGEKNIKLKKYTYSFHRSLQDYFSALHKQNFAVKKLEEWISNKESQTGPRKNAEDVARKEIPMFMCIEAIKIV